MLEAPKASSLAVLIALVSITPPAYSGKWEFDPDMIGAGKDVDVSVFNQGGQLPGTYSVDILLNGQRVDARDVVFSLEKKADGSLSLYPCLSVELLTRYGVKTEDYSSLSEGHCAKLSAIPDASYDAEIGDQQLLLNIPQASLRPETKGIAPQELWDDGVPALLMSYSANTLRMEQRSYYNGKKSSQSTYGQLNPGANLGAWRLRNQTSWSEQQGHSGKWQTVYTYIERGLYDQKSRLTLGDRSTPGDVFDSVPFRGVMLASDDNMVPYNQRTFAPVIRGVARTQSQIEVKQNGYTIYNTSVPPGPFALTDLSISGADGGDLLVTVQEADGQNEIFTVPYQTPAIALKEGYLKYSLMTGQYRSSESSVDKKMIGQATVMYGLPWDLTVYGGLQSAEHYQAGSLGLGLSMGSWGAVSLDTSDSRGQRRHHDTENGMAWRARYSKEVIETGTTLTMTRYQVASSGYNTLSDVLDSWDGGATYREENDDERTRRKSSTQLMLTQNLDRWGSLNLNVSRSYYWDQQHENSVGAGYGVGLPGGVSMSINWNENRQVNNNSSHSTNRVLSMNFSVPLERWLGGRTQASYAMTSSSQGSTTDEVGLNGDTLDDRMSWDIRQRHESGSSASDPDNSYMRLGWRGTYGTVGGNYSYSRYQRQMGADLSGGVVIHSNGITFGQTLGDTIALVEAPGASGIPVSGSPGVRTDFRGYGVQSWLSPYQKSTVSLDPMKLPETVDITQTDVDVIPTQGAVIPAIFVTRTGGRALMIVMQSNGQPVPFGALVTLENQEGTAGIVGSDGAVYLTGLPESGQLLAKWSDLQCHLSYHLPDNNQPSEMYNLKGICR